MTTYNGYIHKFTISGDTDCYLKVGLVGPMDTERFKHLNIGDICHLDLSVSKQADELRVYEVLFEIANRLIEVGGCVSDICQVMRAQQMFPRGTTSNNKIPMCSSICDFIARYLEDKQ